MASPSWMIDRLARETAVHHADADHALDALFHPGITLDDYRAYLVVTYGFEAPLEAALSQVSTLDTLVDLRGRARAGLLASDLLGLGMRPGSIAELPMCLAVPQFRSLAEALGWMYVAERASLSNAVVRRHLLTCLPGEVSTTSSYLEAAGGLLGSRWRQFGDALDRVAHHRAVAERIRAAAQEAFRCQARWSAAAPNARTTGPRRAVG